MILFYQLYFISDTGKIFKDNTGNIGYMKRLTQSTIMTVMIPVWESDLMGESFDIQTFIVCRWYEIGLCRRESYNNTFLSTKGILMIETSTAWYYSRPNQTFLKRKSYQMLERFSSQRRTFCRFVHLK